MRGLGFLSNRSQRDWDLGASVWTDWLLCKSSKVRSLSVPTLQFATFELSSRDNPSQASTFKTGSRVALP